jgi:hypothetical protein
MVESLLGWKSKLTLADMCRDQWGWAQKYPQVSFCVTLAGGVFDTARVLLGQREWQQELLLFLLWLSYIWIWGRACGW